MGRVVLRACLGLGLILCGGLCYVGINRWMHTRIVYPIDIPISLAARHVRTRPFRLNLNAMYWVVVDSGEEAWHPGLKCAYGFPRTQSRWVLYKDGRIFDRDDNLTPINWPTGFNAGPGIYDLDLEILWDTSCLDPSHPSLHIYALTENYETCAQILKVGCLAAVGLGLIVLVFLPAIERIHSGKTESIPIGSATNAVQYRWAAKLPLRPVFSALPSFGLYAAIFYAVLALLMILITFGFQVTRRGLWVHLLKQGQVVQKSDAWTESVIVMVKDAGPGQEPTLLLNSKRVSWNDFRLALKHELARRKDWIVYVGGDDCLAYVNVANVIDIARGYGAKVFLVDTPERKPCDMPPSLVPVRH